MIAMVVASVVLGTIIVSIISVIIRNALEGAYHRGLKAAELQLEVAWDAGAEAERVWMDSGRDPKFYPTNPFRI